MTSTLWVHCYPNVGHHRYLLGLELSEASPTASSSLLSPSVNAPEWSVTAMKTWSKISQKKWAVLAVTPVLVRQCLEFWWLFTSLQDLLSALTNSKLPHTDCSAPHKGRANTRALRRLDLRGQSQGLATTRCITYAARLPDHTTGCKAQRGTWRSPLRSLPHAKNPFGMCRTKMNKRSFIGTNCHWFYLGNPRDYLWLVFCLLPRLHVFAPVSNSAVYCPFKRKVL